MRFIAGKYKMSTLLKRKASFFVGWEMILVYVFLLLNVLMMVYIPYIYFEPGSLAMIVQSAMIPAMMVFGMIFILLLGDIDVSVASIMLMSAMVMGYVYGAVGNAFIAIACALLTGMLCGFFNGVLVAKLRLPAVIVTIASSMLFRGIVKVIMGTASLNTYPKWLKVLSWDSLAGIPVSLLSFILVGIVFGLLLHATRFGRSVYAMGNNAVAAEYSGLRTTRIKIAVFVITGFMASICSLFYIGLYSGIDSSAGTGLELDVIAICALGGVSTAGGKGNIFGPVVATLIYGFLFYMLGLFGVEANTRKIITGLILIITVSLPMIRDRIAARVHKNR